MTSEWVELYVEDRALGIAVREVDGELQVRANTVAGGNLLRAACAVAGCITDGPTPLTGFTLDIDSAHRLAFARALARDWFAALAATEREAVTR